MWLNVLNILLSALVLFFRSFFMERGGLPQFSAVCSVAALLRLEKSKSEQERENLSKMPNNGRKIIRKWIALWANLRNIGAGFMTAAENTNRL